MKRYLSPFVGGGRCYVAAVAVLLLVIQLPAQVVYQWVGTSSKDARWSTSSNWKGGAVPPDGGKASVVLTSATSHSNPDLDSNYAIYALTFGDGSPFSLISSGGKTLSLGAGGITQDNNIGALISAALKFDASQTWTSNDGLLLVSGGIDTSNNNFTVAGDGSTYLSGKIVSGSAGNTLTKTGKGTLFLAGGNSFGHLLRLSEGDVVLSSSTALGDATWNNEIGAAGTLRLAGGITVSEGSFKLAGTIGNDSGTNRLSAQIVATGNGTVRSDAGSLELTGYVDTNGNTLAVTGAGAVIFGQIGGSGGMSLSGAGNRTFRSDYYASGALAVGGEGTTTFSGRLSTGALAISGSGNATFSSTTSVTGAMGVSGSGTITFGQEASAGTVTVNGSGTTNFRRSVSATSLVFAGSGNITVSSDVNVNGGTLTINNTNSAATVTIGGSVNASSGNITVSGASAVQINGSQINGGNLSVSTSGAFTTASTLNLGSGTLTFAGSGTSTLTGSQINAGRLYVSGTGNQVLNTTVGVNILELSGAGTTTLSGSGSNSMTTTTVNSGVLNLSKSSGAALTGDLFVQGGQVVFAGGNQTTAWTDVSMSGGTLLLNNTAQSFASLSITGNSIIDFGSGNSTLSLESLSISAGAYLTLLNWASTDNFIALTAPSADTLARIIFGSAPGASWTAYDSRIRPGTPVPEPATYGAVLCAAGLLGGVALRWCRARRRGAQ